MKLLYLGDIMASAGLQVVEQELAGLVKEHEIDLVAVQAENVSDGRGMSIKDMRKLQALGVDFFTGGNWTGNLSELHKLLEDPNEPVIGPANQPDCPGLGYKTITKNDKTITFISLLGQTVGRTPESTNPLIKVDQILNDNQSDITIVNFHGDFSSEKRIIGYYLDGKVAAAVGDHWHVPTADAMVLPKGTAHITDVGMCGSLHNSLGVSLESVIPRWRDGVQTRNIQDSAKPWQLNGVVIDVMDNGLASSIKQIHKIIE